MNSCSFSSKSIEVNFDKDRGIITSLQLKGDDLQTNFIGNKKNISYQSIQDIDQWTGDVRLRIWDNSMARWNEERTSSSDDIRTTKMVGGRQIFETSYSGRSKNEAGLKSVDMNNIFQIEDEGLHWYLVIKNTTENLLEMGELSLPFITNTDFKGIFEDSQYENKDRWRGIKQKLWHEQRVQQFLSINGSSSYAFLQRPKGDYPAVLFQVLGDDGIEEAYQIDNKVGLQWECTFEGPYYLSLYSKAAKACEGWRNETEQQTIGLNGHNSLLLERGEEKQFHFVFHTINNHRQMKEFIYEEGGIDVDVHPGMVAPINTEIQMRIRCKDEIRIVPGSNNITLHEVSHENGIYYYKMKFMQTGQKIIKVRHGKGLTTLAFYAIDEIRKLLDNHAAFIVERQYYNNPQDPFDRHHAFLPYDNALEMLFTESTESWQVGALDEYALPVAMYVAEMNSIRPNQKQIDIMEEYIDTCLYGKLQEKETYYARRGMYYVEPTPSDRYNGAMWDKETSESILRSFNYPLITDIYYAMYKIADKYRLTKIRSKEVYLEMAFKTAMVGYELGKNKFNGAPAGATIICLLETLKVENPIWYNELNKKIERIAEENMHSEYPFGSELYVDQTSHNQYEAMMRYYQKEEKLEEIYRITYALRNGWQPQWFNYGNEKRGNVCCWYGTPLNSRVLYDGFEYTGKKEMLKLGLAGVLCFLTTIRSNGAAFGWYLCWPDRSGFDMRSLDTDMGMYGYLYSAKAYLAEDDLFGLCGFGCELINAEKLKIVKPVDGLGIRFMSVVDGFDFEFTKGNYKKLIIDDEKHVIILELGMINGEWDFTIQANEIWTLYIGEEKHTIGKEKKTKLEGRLDES